jgi:hypothetical protein
MRGICVSFLKLYEPYPNEEEDSLWSYTETWSNPDHTKNTRAEICPTLPGGVETNSRGSEGLNIFSMDILSMLRSHQIYHAPVKIIYGKPIPPRRSHVPFVKIVCSNATAPALSKLTASFIIDRTLVFPKFVLHESK